MIQRIVRKALWGLFFAFFENFFVPILTSGGLAAVSSSFFAALYSAFGRYDVVHIHAEGPAFFCWLPKLFGKRVVVTIHGIDWQREKWQSGLGSRGNTPKNISAATVARTAVLGLALTNQLLSAAGKPVLPIESTQVEQLVSAGFTIGAALASWWYNNSFTQAAIKADEEFERQKKRV